MPAYAADRPDQLAGFDLLTSMSGLDFMRAMQDGRVAGPPIAGLMNFWIDRVEDGRVRFRGVPEFPASNPMGSLHGGWYGTLLDSCMGCAVMTKVPKGHVYTTLEYKVNIVRAIPLGTEIIADGIVQHAGRSTGIASAEIRGAGDDRLYATGSTTCLIMKPGTA